MTSQVLVQTPRLDRRQEFEQRLATMLENSVDPVAAAYWDEKVRGGNVPTETKIKMGPNLDMNFVKSEMKRLAKFVAEIVERVLNGEWGSPINQTFGDEVHYFGLGTGVDVREVAIVVNKRGMRLIGYDISTEACTLGDQSLPQSDDLQNRVFRADITFACQKKIIRKKKARLLVACRVVDILDKQHAKENQSPTKGFKAGKTAKTMRRMGKLLEYLQCILIYPCPQDNPNAIWGDTTPHDFELILQAMREGYGGEIEAINLSQIDFHGHVYTAVLVRKRS